MSFIASAMSAANTAVIVPMIADDRAASAGFASKSGNERATR